MDLALQIRMNENLYLRNPEETELGRRIIRHSILMILDLGFEAFTFKKLAVEIGSTEASTYRYFENKHRLLLYIVSWYWSWLEYKITVHTNNIEDPMERLKKVILILGTYVEDDINTPHVDEDQLFKVVMVEGAKAFLTRHVDADYKQKIFKPYKSLCDRISAIICECNPEYAYARSLSSTLVETANFQNFFKRNLPSLTDFDKDHGDAEVVKYLEQLVFSAISK